MFRKFKQHLKAHFLTGIVVLLPAVVSIKILLWLVTKADNLLKPMVEDILGGYVFGAGICLIIPFIFVVGLLAQNYVGKKLVKLVGAIFDRVPFIRTVYSVVRQLLEPFSGEERNTFRQAVLIEFPMKDRFALGFIANDNVGYRDGQKMITVFLPTNHLHLGTLVIIREDEVIPVDLNVEEALKIIVSCGIVVPRQFSVRDANGTYVSVEGVSGTTTEQSRIGETS